MIIHQNFTKYNCLNHTIIWSEIYNIPIWFDNETITTAYNTKRVSQNYLFVKNKKTWSAHKILEIDLSLEVEAFLTEINYLGI